MKICIVGAGAIGCWIAAQLSLAGEAVTLVARGEQRDVIARDGLVIDTPRHGARTTRLSRVVSSVVDAADCDTILLTVKAHQVEPIASDLKACIDAGATLVSLQNGLPWWYLSGSGSGSSGDHVLRAVDPGGRLAASLAARSVIGGVLYVASGVPSPGHVHVLGKGKIVLGEAAPDASASPSARSLALAALLKRCDIASDAVADIRTPIWQKLWRNAPLSPVSVITRTSLGEIVSNPLLERLLRDIMEEVRLTARSVGVHLDDSPDDALDAARKNGTHKSSMLQDFERGRPLELGAIVGAVIELAERGGVPTPHLSTLLACAAALALKASAA